MNEDKATRYHRLKRRLAVASLAGSAVVLIALLWTGGSAALRTLAADIAGRIAPAWTAALTVPTYTLMLAALLFVLGTPLAFYDGLVLERRYGLSVQPVSRWCVDQLKAAAVSLPLAVLGGSAVYAVIAAAGNLWWLPAGILFALFTVGAANLAPVVLLPLFFRIKPLGREALRERLLALASRAGAEVVDAYEWGLGEKTRKANAALAGLGATRRILVSDTMLGEYSDDEIEIVLAHELAHHVHGDIWKLLAFDSLLLLLGFYAAARALDALALPLGLDGAADVAGLPLIVLAAGTVSLVTMPLGHALSRACERSADRFALALTRNPAAFISAMRRLGARNLAEERPSPLVQWLFYSHPPVRERIEAARGFAAEQGGPGLARGV